MSFIHENDIVSWLERVMVVAFLMIIKEEKFALLYYPTRRRMSTSLDGREVLLVGMCRGSPATNAGR